MMYKLFNGYSQGFSRGDSVPSLDYTGEVVVAIDPSKTNCALVVGDPGGYILSIVEMSGNNWRSGPVEDTTQFCSEVKEFITNHLAGAKVIKAGLEKAITKKGMNHHHSNMVLTEIRGAILNLFYEEYGFRHDQVEVNNWSWKHAILPEGYRSQSEKGSKRYFSQYLNDKTYVHYFEADVTDCLCIYKYLIRDCKDTYTIACQAAETPLKKFNIGISSGTWADQLNYRRFSFNPSFTLEENVAYFVNHSKVNGIACVDPKYLTLQDIYTHAYGFQTLPEKDEVRVLAQIC